MKKILKWGGIILFVLIVIGVVSGGGENSESNSSGTKQEQQAEQMYMVGDTISSKNMELIVSSVEERNSVGSQYVRETVSEGGTLVVVNWQYKNTSAEPIGTFSQPSLKVEDANGVEYSSDGGKTASYTTEIKLDRKILSDLNPGITVKDAEVFEVSKEAYEQGGWFVVVKADGKNYKVQIN